MSRSRLPGAIGSPNSSSCRWPPSSRCGPMASRHRSVAAEDSGRPGASVKWLPRGRGSVGRAPPCQGGGRGFESRRPLQWTTKEFVPARRAAMRPGQRYSHGMQPLRYSINVTLDGCCDHREGVADEELHRHAAENIARADALLFGRVTYEMMEAAWREPARTGARPDWMDEWMDPCDRQIDAAKKY